jgi:hypothetical protein
MKPSPSKEWNREVDEHVAALAGVKNWLDKMTGHPDNDWAAKKSAHQALKFLELAEYEMWNMQCWESQQEYKLYIKGEDTVA